MKRDKFICDTECIIRDIEDFLVSENISMSKFSNLIGYSRAYVSRVLNRKLEPSVNMVYEVARVIGVDPFDYLYASERLLVNKDRDFDLMDIDELTRWIEKLKEIRAIKIQEKIDELNAQKSLLHNQIESYEQLLTEEES